MFECGVRRDVWWNVSERVSPFDVAISQSSRHDSASVADHQNSVKHDAVCEADSRHGHACCCCCCSQHGLRCRANGADAKTQTRRRWWLRFDMMMIVILTVGIVVATPSSVQFSRQLTHRRRHDRGRSASGSVATCRGLISQRLTYHSHGSWNCVGKIFRTWKVLKIWVQGPGKSWSFLTSDAGCTKICASAHLFLCSNSIFAVSSQHVTAMTIYAYGCYYHNIYRVGQKKTGRQTWL